MLFCLPQLKTSAVPKLSGVLKAPALLSGLGQGHTRLSTLHTPLCCCRIFQGMVVVLYPHQESTSPPPAELSILPLPESQGRSDLSTPSPPKATVMV